MLDSRRSAQYSCSVPPCVSMFGGRRAGAGAIFQLCFPRGDGMCRRFRPWHRRKFCRRIPMAVQAFQRCEGSGMELNGWRRERVYRLSFTGRSVPAGVLGRVDWALCGHGSVHGHRGVVQGLRGGSSCSIGTGPFGAGAFQEPSALGGIGSRPQGVTLSMIWRPCDQRPGSR